MTIGKSYKWVNVRSGEVEVFDEDDLVPTDPHALSWDRHATLS